MLRRLLSAFCIFFLLFTACKDEEVTPRPYPRVRTHGVSGITSNGAMFNGEITFASVAIQDFGFIWSVNRGFEPSEKISLGSKNGAGKFSSPIERSLAEGVKYYVKAYAKSSEYLVYGDIQEFVSLGSKAPKIISIKPTSGTWGDTVIIAGENFSTIKNNNIVKFDAVEAEVLINKPDTIFCTVPHELANGPVDVLVSLFGNEAKLVSAFQLAQPVINSVNPSSGTVNTVVVITGKFFSPTHTKVFFADTEATINQLTATEVVCKVPPGLTSGNLKLTVRTGQGNLFAESEFAAQEPLITNIAPLQGTYDDIVTITGENFVTEANFNTVKFGSVTAQIMTLTASEIKVKVPVNLATHTHEISLTYGSKKIVYDQTFSLLAPEIFEITPLKIYPGASITITGKNFSPGNNTVNIGGVNIQGVNAQIISNTHNIINVDIPSVTSHELTIKVTASGQSDTYGQNLLSDWVKLGNAPFSVTYPLVRFTINNDIFICTQEETGLPALYRFQNQTKTWAKKTEPPFDIEGAFSFSLDGKGYVGGGFSMSSLWEYDPVSDNWTENGALPIGVYNSLGFAIDDKGYFVGGHYTSDYSDSFELWEYNPDNNTWQRRKDIPSFSGDFGFIYNGKFYSLYSSFYYNIYDPSLDDWSFGETSESNYFITSSLFHFNGKLYYLQTNDYYYEPWVLTSYDLNTQKWAVSDFVPTGIIAETNFQSDNAVYLFVPYSPLEIWEFVPDL